PRTAYELAQAMWGNVAVTQAYLTLSEVLGHVDLLRNDGHVVETEEGGVARFAVAYHPAPALGVGGDIVGFATLVATAGFGTAAGVLVVRRRLDHLRGSARAVALGLTVTAALVGVHLVPGAVGLLYPGVVAAFAAALAGLCSLLPYAPAGGVGDEPVNPDDPPLSRALALVSVVAVGVACVAYLRLNGDRVPIAIDALSFHLPDVARWVQQHGFWQIHQFIP